MVWLSTETVLTIHVTVHWDLKLEWKVQRNTELYRDTYYSDNPLSLAMLPAIPVCPTLWCFRPLMSTVQLGSPLVITLSSFRSHAVVTSSRNVSEFSWPSLYAGWALGLVQDCRYQFSPGSLSILWSPRSLHHLRVQARKDDRK